MLNMYCDHYISKIHQVDGAKARRFQIRPARKRKYKPLPDHSVDVLAALQASWVAAERLAKVTGQPHHIRDFEVARQRLVEFKSQKRANCNSFDGQSLHAKV